MNPFDKFADRYDSWYEKYPAVFESEVAALSRVLSWEGLFLEVGVGTGRFAERLNVAFGVDPAFNALRMAKSRGIRVCKAVAENLPFRNALFDAVIFCFSLCFVQDKVLSLMEAKRVLKDSGRLIIGFIDRDSFLGKKYMESASVFYESASFLSMNDLQNLLGRCGFKTVDVWQTIFCDPENIKSFEEPLEGWGQGGFVVVGAVKANPFCSA